uniref:hypothetical protein n=1 Tax=uncultured Erythrobacter sp. TaxID=263913 RepID=UPI0026135D11|nr:hypothetical protein [uncultured Erythrobacter sp.]
MFEIILEYRVEAQRLASIILMLAAFKWGGAPEKIVTTTFVLFFTVPLTAFEWLADGPLIFSGGRLVYVALEVMALSIFLGVALNANRNYPLWLAGFQIVALVAHMVRGLVDSVSPLAYAILAIGPSYFQLILMLAGLIRHVRRNRKYGEYRDWRVPLPSLFRKKQVPEGLKGQM